MEGAQYPAPNAYRRSRASSTSITMRVTLIGGISLLVLVLVLSHIRDARYHARQGERLIEYVLSLQPCIGLSQRCAFNAVAGKLAVRRHLQEAWTSRRLLETNVTSDIAPSTAESSIMNSPTSSGATNNAASAALAAGQAGKAATIAADATGMSCDATLCISCFYQLRQNSSPLTRGRSTLCRQSMK